MHKIIATTVFLLLTIAGAHAGSYQYISAPDLKGMLDSREAATLLDIQVEAEFAAHHIPGALATFAYPVKTDADKAKLGSVLAQVKQSEEPVVIVCPRGGGGAKRTYDYLQQQGVTGARLHILEGGQAKWPY